MPEKNIAIHWSVASIEEDGSVRLSCEPMTSAEAMAMIQQNARGHAYVVLRTADRNDPRSRFVRFTGHNGKEPELTLSAGENGLIVHYAGKDLSPKKASEAFGVKAGDLFSQITVADTEGVQFSSPQTPQDHSTRIEASPPNVES